MSEDHGHRFAVYSPTGVHIGLWADGKIASQVQAESPGNTLEELVTLDLAQAMVAANDEAIRAALGCGFPIDEIKPNPKYRATLAAMLAKAREDALSEAAALAAELRHQIYNDIPVRELTDVEVCTEIEQDILALIEKDATDVSIR